MQYKPHSYQKRAYDWIMDKPRCALFLDMGMGKTVTTLTAISDLIDSLDVERVLVIAPKRVAEDTWSRECDKWDHLNHLNISKILGSAEERKMAAEEDADIYIINRENVVWLVENTEWKWDMIVIDELSSFKSGKSKRFKALRKYAAGAARVVGLTGTPAANGYLDLWSEVYLIDRGERLGRTITAYRTQYFRNISNSMAYAVYVPASGAQRIINRKLSDICMSMTADDYLKMPERIDNVIPVRLSEAERKKYKKLEREQFLMMEDDEAITAFSAAALTGKLLQLANGFLYDENKESHRIHEKKVEALQEILDISSSPVLVFYNFQADREVLLERFPDARELKTSDDISAWNAREVQLMIAHPASVGHGLNIQDGGHIIVWYGLTWSLELYQQANARLHRQGQGSDHVIIHHLVAEGTVDEQVMTALQKKKVSQDYLIKALKERRDEVYTDN